MSISEDQITDTVKDYFRKNIQKKRQNQFKKDENCLKENQSEQKEIEQEKSQNELQNQNQKDLKNNKSIQNQPNLPRQPQNIQTQQQQKTDHLPNINKTNQQNIAAVPEPLTQQQLIIDDQNISTSANISASEILQKSQSTPQNQKKSQQHGIKSYIQKRRDISKTNFLTVLRKQEIETLQNNLKQQKEDVNVKQLQVYNQLHNFDQLFSNNETEKLLYHQVMTDMEHQLINVKQKRNDLEQTARTLYQEIFQYAQILNNHITARDILELIASYSSFAESVNKSKARRQIINEMFSDLVINKPQANQLQQEQTSDQYSYARSSRKKQNRVSNSKKERSQTVTDHKKGELWFLRLSEVAQLHRQLLESQQYASQADKALQNFDLQQYIQGINSQLNSTLQPLEANLKTVRFQEFESQHSKQQFALISAKQQTENNTYKIKFDQISKSQDKVKTPFLDTCIENVFERINIEQVHGTFQKVLKLLRESYDTPQIPFMNEQDLVEILSMLENLCLNHADAVKEMYYYIKQQQHDLQAQVQKTENKITQMDLNADQLRDVNNSIGDTSSDTLGQKDLTQFEYYIYDPKLFQNFDELRLYKMECECELMNLALISAALGADIIKSEDKQMGPISILTRMQTFIDRGQIMITKCNNVGQEIKKKFKQQQREQTNKIKEREIQEDQEKKQKKEEQRLRLYERIILKQKMPMVRQFIQSQTKTTEQKELEMQISQGFSDIGKGDFFDYNEGQ